MRIIISTFSVLSCLLLFSTELFAQPMSNPWRKVQLSEINTTNERLIQPAKESLYFLDLDQIRQTLSLAPLEFTPQAQQTPLSLAIPMPDGRLQQFHIIRSPIAAPALLAKYSGIQTYAGKGVDDPTATIRLDVTPTGFHGMILSAQGDVFIDPYAKGTPNHYSSYYKQDFHTSAKQFVCEMTDKDFPVDPFTPQAKSFGDCQFRTFRLALAATAEYTSFHGGKPQAIAAQITTMNRVNGVLERDLAIRLVIIPNNDTLVYTNASTDPYSNGNASVMLNQNRNNLNNVIGAANYDIGHVFGVGSGGVASLGSICVDNQKARGVTGIQNPVGDPFDIDYVAHEMGHQLGGRHTFNGTAGSCGGNISPVAAYETGSGSTIMAYAGICGSHNVQQNSDAYYHAYSLEEMSLEIVNASCATIVSSSNSAPTILDPSFSYAIPANTPFFLEVAASDPDGDSLTYCWEQFDNQLSTQPPVSSSVDGPNFRSLSPTDNPRRYFPALDDVINGTSTQWEVLPSVSRTMNFIVTVRDNALVGCTDSEEGSVIVAGNAGPFVVLHPSTTGISWQGFSAQQISWDVAGTDNAPVNCDSVDILLSLDGGLTYPITLATGVPNSGTYSINVPDTSSTTARIMIHCSDGIFYDISDNDFAITQNSGPNFFLSLTAPQTVVCAPDSGDFSLSVGGILGFQDTVGLTAVIDPPSAMSANVIQSSLNPGDSTVISLQNTSQVAPGFYTLTILGVSSSLQNQASITFEVLAGAPAISSLVFPQAGMLGVSQFPVFDWQGSPLAHSYTLEVATDSSFTNLAALQTNLDSPLVGLPYSLNPSTFYYWRIRAENPCGTSVSPTQFFFTQGNACDTSSSTDVPKTIASAIPNVVSSTLQIPFQGSITDIKVSNLTGFHSWVNDLTISLESPSGTSVTLMSQICGNENNFDIEFSDGGAPYTSIPCPPVDGMTYQPSEMLSAFFGEDPQGTWTLRVQDIAQQDGGSLQSWGLEICYNPSTSCSVPLTSQTVEISCNGVCDGELSASTSSGSSPLNYHWSTGQTDSLLTGLCAGSYILVVQDAMGCFGSESVQLVDPPSFGVATSITDASCAGATDGSVSFAISGGVMPYTVDLGGFDTTALAAGQYSALITDDVGCSDTVDFEIQEPPAILLDFGPDGTECEGETVVLDASGLGQGFTYLWSTGETSSSISVSDSGLYWVVLTDAANCTGGDSIHLDFLPPAMADFTFTQTGGMVNFQNTSSNGSYLWTFGDGNTSTDMAPTHTFGDTGVYTVSLIVDPQNGCSADTLSQQITIRPSTGISLLEKGSVQVYPNPAAHSFIVEFADVSFSRARLSLHNHLGQRIVSKELVLESSSHQEGVLTESLAEGVYYMSLEVQNRTVFSDRIVIQR
ncbi:MAG: reprolysin-like metallopeptidase [Bacteroidota bacterium]